MYYSITATVEKKQGKSITTMQIPAFLLDATTQGITSEAHARFIAEEIINPLRMKVKVNVCVVEV